MLDRSHLTIINEVQQRGTLTGAAKKLHLTQPALSHAIKKLEQQLGTVIWVKEGRKLRLTPAGEYLLRLAQRVLPQLSHAERVIEQIAKGQRGVLRIGMECHPCYRWLLRVVAPFLEAWPDVDVDVKQKFQFGGIGALFAYEIDVLVSPDPLLRKGLQFTPVFNYEQVLVVGEQHWLATADFAEPKDLVEETLITYPVEAERLDVFTQFLSPANLAPKAHKTIETTDIMLQMVAAGRGVAALPRWLVDEYSERLPIRPVSMGRKGLAKQIFLGLREADAGTDYIAAFASLAARTGNERAGFGAATVSDFDV